MNDRYELVGIEGVGTATGWNLGAGCAEHLSRSSTPFMNTITGHFVDAAGVLDCILKGSLVPLIPTYRLEGSVTNTYFLNAGPEVLDQHRPLLKVLGEVACLHVEEPSLGRCLLGFRDPTPDPGLALLSETVVKAVLDRRLSRDQLTQCSAVWLSPKHVGSVALNRVLYPSSRLAEFWSKLIKTPPELAEYHRLVDLLGEALNGDL
jgi:hypothetical protein